MPRLLDSKSTVAVLLGAHDWRNSGLITTASFRRSANGFKEYLLDRSPSGLGLGPESVLDLFDDPSAAADQLTKVSEVLKKIIRGRSGGTYAVRDLLIYYVGHGSSQAGRHLQLLVRATREGIEGQTSLSTQDLAEVLRVAAPKQRRLAVFDCCFSEKAADAFGAMSALDEAVAATAVKDLATEHPTPERGTLVLCSSPRQQTSIGLPDAEYTLFTGALLDVLRKGSRLHHSETFSFADLREYAFSRMLESYEEQPPRPALHQPDQRDGDLTLLPAFYNVAFGGSTPANTEEASKARSSRILGIDSIEANPHAQRPGHIPTSALTSASAEGRADRPRGQVTTSKRQKRSTARDWFFEYGLPLLGIGITLAAFVAVMGAELKFILPFEVQGLSPEPITIQLARYQLAEVNWALIPSLALAAVWVLLSVSSPHYTRDYRPYWCLLWCLDAGLALCGIILARLTWEMAFLTIGNALVLYWFATAPFSTIGRKFAPLGSSIARILW